MLSCKEDLTCPSGNVVSVRHPVLHIWSQDVEPVIHKQQPLGVQPCSVVWGGAITVGQTSRDRAVPLTYQRMQNHLCFADMTHGHCATGQPVLVRQRDVLQQHFSCTGKHPISRAQGNYCRLTNKDKLGQQQR